MKFIKSYQIFESSQSYSYTFHDNIYYFIDDFNNQFRVEFNQLDETDVEMKYLVKDGDIWSYKEVETNIFRLIETLFGKILKDFIGKNDWCNSIIIKGLASVKEKEEITRRTKVFWRYLQNNPIEGWSQDKYINEIFLDRN